MLLESFAYMNLLAYVIVLRKMCAGLVVSGFIYAIFAFIFAIVMNIPAALFGTGVDVLLECGIHYDKRLMYMQLWRSWPIVFVLIMACLCGTFKQQPGYSL